MESLAYLHLAEAYEDPSWENREIVLFKGLDWRKINSRWIQIVSLLLALSLISFANVASALQRGNSGPEVTTLQNALKREGVFPSDQRSTGYYGSITEQAVKDFQALNGLPVNGIAGPETLGVLYSYYNPNGYYNPDNNFNNAYVNPIDPRFLTVPQYRELQLGSRGEEVRILQQALQEKVNYYLSVDGVYGYSTQDAVSRYQSGIGMTPTGIADRDTLALLYGTENRSASAPIPEVVVDNGIATGFGYPNSVSSVPYPGESSFYQSPYSGLDPGFGGQAPLAYCRRVQTNTGRNLNLRSQPTTAGRIIRKIPSGSEIIIFEGGTNGWVQAQFGQDYGFVSAKFLKQCL